MRVNMKKIITLCFIITLLAGCGVRKNWKTTKNVTFLLQNQPIALALRIYGTPSETRKTPKENLIYIWGAENNRLRKIQTTGQKQKAEKIDFFSSNAIMRYDYVCYVALKVDANGKIIDGMQLGFEPDRLSPECRGIFLRSLNFCNQTVKQTQQSKLIKWADCHRQDFSTQGPIQWVISDEDKTNSFYQRDDFFNN